MLSPAGLIRRPSPVRSRRFGRRFTGSGGRERPCNRTTPALLTAPPVSRPRAVRRVHARALAESSADLLPANSGPRHGSGERINPTQQMSGPFRRTVPAARLSPRGRTNFPLRRDRRATWFSCSQCRATRNFPHNPKRFRDNCSHELSNRS